MNCVDWPLSNLSYIKMILKDKIHKENGERK